MRGARRVVGPRGLRGGIIPAYAGSTRMITSAAQGARDHPRVCGEHLPLLETFHEYPGSSPRMRGARDAAVLVITGVGIIPAYAGSTGRGGRSSGCGRDHPRVCGEHESSGSSERRNEGSSPRMRGAPDTLAPAAARAGIIPAYAGSTWWYSHRSCILWDHPRVCGEHSNPSFPQSQVSGSSPRMRGAPYHA